ncbi:unnamed protein product, partial [Mycena citricolor]
KARGSSSVHLFVLVAFLHFPVFGTITMSSHDITNDDVPRALGKPDPGLHDTIPRPLYTSPTRSSSTLPRLARSVRGAERERIRDNDSPSLFSPYYRSPISESSSRPGSPISPSKSKRVPRPPNAFILFRSDLVRNGGIPDTVERRQQTLSRVAGECWNLLDPMKKREWQEKAAKLASDHMRDHPDYHFKPAPRGKGKSKPKLPGNNSADFVRSLRETYLDIHGPSICSSRRKGKEGEEMGQPSPGAELVDPLHVPLSSHLPVYDVAMAPFDAPQTSSYNWTPYSDGGSVPPSLCPAESMSNNPPLPPFFPQHSFPHFSAPRRPSTSMGFVRSADQSRAEAGFDVERPASAASDTDLSSRVRGLDLSTPAIDGIPSSHFHYSPEHTFAVRSPFPFSHLNPQATSHFSDVMDHVSHTNYPETSFMHDYQYSAELAPPFAFDNWTFDNAGHPMVESSQ